MKIKIFILCIFSVVFNSSCSDEFIDLAPISNANESNFYQSEQDFTNAIYGAYSTLKLTGVYSDYVQLIGDLRSDNTEMGSTASTRYNFFELSDFMVQETSPIVANVWNHHYSGIRRVNTILDRIDDVELTSVFENRIIGEAKFLRGLFYFNLVRIFGDVPLVINGIQTVEESYAFSRVETSQVYAQIIEDLESATNLLSENIGSEYGRASQGAAWALLGKVFLTSHQYEKARDALESVINSNHYQLLEKYEDLWKVENENHSESIFDVQFEINSSASTASRFTERYTPYLYTNLPFSNTSGGYNIPTEDLINAYEENDIRKDASLRDHYVTPDGTVVSGLTGRFTIKYFDTPVYGVGSGNNWPVLRYADVLLMYAEALNEIGFEQNGMAFTMLNTIRNRAGLPNKTFDNSDSSLSVNNQEEFRLAIEQERRVELAFEGHRWFDLVRTGRAIEVLGPKVANGIQPHQLILPIPLSQTQINPDNITQNPGY